MKFTKRTQNDQEALRKAENMELKPQFHVIQA